MPEIGTASGLALSLLEGWLVRVRAQAMCSVYMPVGLVLTQVGLLQCACAPDAGLT